MKSTNLHTLLVPLAMAILACASVPQRDAIPGEQLDLPAPVSRPPPRYPSRALQKEPDGSVTVDFLLPGDGSVSDVRVIESEPPGLFETAVKRAVRQWRYQPLVVDGVQVRTRSRPVSIYFLLNKCPEIGDDPAHYIKICGFAQP